MRELPTRVRSSVVTRAIVTNGEVAAHRIARDATKRRPVVITRMRRILPQDALAVIKAPRASPSLFPGALPPGFALIGIAASLVALAPMSVRTQSAARSRARVHANPFSRALAGAPLM